MRATTKTLSAGAALALLALGLGPLAACRGDAARPVIGVKIYEAAAPFDGLFGEWRDLGVNTAFVSEALLADADFRARAKADRLTLFLIYPVFQAPEAIKEDPGLAAVTASGAPARDEWVEFVCPTEGEGFLDRRAAHLRDLVARHDPEYVSLDFIRYFVFWEKVAPDRNPASLPQTCFCPDCLAAFERAAGLAVPPELATTAAKAAWILSTHAAAWTDWKCGRVADVVSRFVRAAREAEPSVKVNLHAVPWRRDDFGGAVRSVAGQDLARLAPLVDLVSPMTYHHMVRRTPAWVHDIVADAAALAGGAPVLPSIQVDKAYVDEDLPPAEFRAALEQALRPPSRGVVLWSWAALAGSPEKKDILRSVASRRGIEKPAPIR